MNVNFVKYNFFESIITKLSKEGLIDYSMKWYHHMESLGLLSKNHIGLIDSEVLFSENLETINEGEI